jgi:hypothetical protein
MQSNKKWLQVTCRRQTVYIRHFYQCEQNLQVTSKLTYAPLAVDFVAVRLDRHVHSVWQGAAPAGCTKFKDAWLAATGITGNKVPAGGPRLSV